METKTDTETFSLGITMAGAVSAGCYTAGVMDYLFEILDLWEQGKNNNLPGFNPEEIPRHCVRIDAMGGASAGGMTTTMSALYCLNGKINPVKTPDNDFKPKNNILYDSWVLMDDNNQDDKRPVFEKLWDTDDLKTGKFGSFLNSNFIDKIAENAFVTKDNPDIKDKASKLPSYISRDLQLLYSHCFLRGIPLDVNFETEISKTGRKSVIPNHSTFEHYIVTQYRLNNGVKPKTSKHLWFNPYIKEHADLLKLSTIATGAFPIGLAFREFKTEDLDNRYIRTAIKRVITGEFGNDDPDPDNKIRLKHLPSKYSSVVVDGGAINNEPYREILSILRHKSAPTVDKYPRYGVIMIDPFPDRAQLQKPYVKPLDAIDVAGKIINTLMDQSRIKRREMLETDPSQYFRSIIFPRKWRTNESNEIIGAPETITCASAMSFGGFLDINFRKHDFFLGRNNARNFLRYFFSFPYYKDENDPTKNDIHPIHREWTSEMVDAFKFEQDEGSGNFYLPIIPDLYLLNENKEERKNKRTYYDVPYTPKYNPENIFKLEKNIKKRFSHIFKVLQNRDFTREIEETEKAQFEKLTKIQQEKLLNQKKNIIDRKAIAETWIKKKYKKSWLTEIGSFLITPLTLSGIFFAKRIAAKKLTQKIISEILLDLADKNLLKKRE